LFRHKGQKSSKKTALHNLKNSFKSGCSCLTLMAFINIVGSMDTELSDLEQKLAQFARLFKQMREENIELRQQLLVKSDESARLASKVAAAKTRLEALLEQVPEAEV
jgi:cell division protein ZapB